MISEMTFQTGIVVYRSISHRTATIPTECRSGLKFNYLEHFKETRCSMIARDDHQSCSPTVPPTLKDRSGVVLRSICDQVLAGQP